MPLTFGIVCFEGFYSTVDDRRISLTMGRLMLVTTVYTAITLILQIRKQTRRRNEEMDQTHSLYHVGMRAG